ncbi:CDP-alcohol phosphatidyltransferase family protein [Phenylobacterium sp. Root700]|uniref:CDP-alcohol phosphatidyltransferase family protein n=1 Tax=Phenylobacterium sp. Root700 TaxID=1736591 RepID=UPI0006F52E88|nr:CDP-alcohol phosphatidyltransferase family protein [Phenylobacterium sp. Root700]KRB42941.1 CDP-diacylglycerol--glycerol-3-phosphate 3-phosphatidyltransferase [Phenylobacterium sp. Root700]
MSEPAPENRRPLKTRGASWAQGLASALARAGLSPDAISAGSVGFAVLGCALFVMAGSASGMARGGLLIGAGVCIQLRLVCNLLDGMVAVEHGKGGPSGPIWNELPDRIADALFLVGAGYCASASGLALGVPLGWAAAVLAVLTAYIRELGRGLGFPADFSGPMAKPHRMAALTATCAVAAFEPLWGWRGQALVVGLAIIVLGTIWTAARRTRTLAARLAGNAA